MNFIHRLIRAAARITLSKPLRGASKGALIFALCTTCASAQVVIGTAEGGLGADNSAASGVPLFATGTVTLTSTIGTGNFARVTSPIFVTPTLGAASATSINGLTLTASTGTLTITNAKTFSVSDTITLASDGTGTRTLNIGTGGTLGTAAFTAASAYVPAYAGLTTSGLLQATSATAVTSTLTPAGLTSVGTAAVTSASALALNASGNVTVNTTNGSTLAATFSGANTTLAGNLIASGTGTFGGTLSFSANGTPVSYGIARTSSNQMQFNGGSAGYVFNNTGNTVNLLTLTDAGNLSVLAGTFTVSTGSSTFGGSILGSGGSAPTNTNSGSNQFTAGIATSGPVYAADSYFNSVRVGRGGGNLQRNTVVGENSLTSTATANSNTAVGYGVMSGGVVSGGNNTSGGHLSMAAVLGGTYNSAWGDSALRYLTSGSYNVGVGGSALGGTTFNGSQDIAIGYTALTNLTTATDFVAVGHRAGLNVTTGTGALFLGSHAGEYEVAGVDKVFYLDALDRASTAAGKTGAMFYGTFNATAASQTLAINASTTVSNTTEATAGGAGSLTTAGGIYVAKKVITASTFENTTGPINYNLSVYATGTVYTLTASDALVDFGTTDPTLVLDKAGTYLLMGRAYVAYNGATYVANQTVTAHLRRTNNTAADVSNATTTAQMRVITTITDSVGVMQMPAVIYTTANTNDSLSVYGSVSATPAAGSVTVNEASIVAIRLY